MLNLDKFEISKYYYIMYFSLLKTKDEIIYIKSLFELINKHGTEAFKNISNVKILIFNLKDENLIMSYKISLIQYVKSDIYCKIKDFIKINNMNMYITDNMSYTKDIENILINIKNKITYINSFDSFNDTITIKDLNDENDNKKCNINAWYVETKHEIINRLDQITKYYKVKLLKEIGVKILDSGHVYEMSYKDVAKYYNNLIETIKKYYKRNYELCGIYEEIINKYSSVENVENLTDFNLSKFDIIITNN